MISIRHAENRDVPTIARLASEAGRLLNAPLMSAYELDAYVNNAEHFDSQLVDDGTYFVAELEGTIVGGGGWSHRRALFGIRGTSLDDGGERSDACTDPLGEAGRLRGFFVSPAHARRGIGRQLVTACEDDARRAGYHRLELVATPAGEPLYGRAGSRWWSGSSS